jgi:hypothetical protein
VTTNRSQASRADIARGLIVAAVLLGVSMALKLLSPEHLSAEFVDRMMGVLLGAMVVVFANAVPKALSPLLQQRCDPAAEQAMRRFTGWSLVLGGAAYAVAWVIAPLEHANVLSAGLLGAALLLVVVRLAWGMANGPRE